MQYVSFTVPGDPVGFMNNRNSWTKNGKRYCAYRDKVVIYALKAGLQLPLKPTREKVYHIMTTAIYRVGKGKVPDPENVAKAVKDALCYRGRMPGKKKGYGDDFWTSGEYNHPMFGAEPCVVVTVREVSDAEIFIGTAKVVHSP